MTITTPARMYDSATPSLIPADAQIVAGYIDGDYAWTPADWARFPGAVKVTITVRGDIYANVADVEPGAMTPEQAAEWIRLKHRAFQHPATPYCNRSTLPTVYTACRGLAYYLWVADWTGQPHPLGGAVAVQYFNQPDQEYDLSVVYDQVWLDAIDAANRLWRWG